MGRGAHLGRGDRGKPDCAGRPHRLGEECGVVAQQELIASCSWDGTIRLWGVPVAE
jgi:hypothetical protein